VSKYFSFVIIGSKFQLDIHSKVNVFQCGGGYVFQLGVNGFVIFISAFKD